jgi:hypothetical protein
VSGDCIVKNRDGILCAMACEMPNGIPFVCSLNLQFMANDPSRGSHDIYYNSKRLYKGKTDFGRFRHFLSNLLFNVYAPYFFKTLNGSWARLKLFALHIHRARAPTADIKQYPASTQYFFYIKNAIYE